MHKTPVLLCYDVSDKKRLQRLQRYVSRHLLQIQYSIYYGVLSPSELTALITTIQSIVNANQDDVRLYNTQPISHAFLLGKNREHLMVFSDDGEQIFW